MARSRLFHAIVVMGLSTVACGDPSAPAPQADAAAKPPSDAAVQKDVATTPIFGSPDASPPDAAADAAVDAGGGWGGPCGSWPCYV